MQTFEDPCKNVYVCTKFITEAAINKSLQKPMFLKYQQKKSCFANK